jgi:hypothetical protein
MAVFDQVDLAGTCTGIAAGFSSLGQITAGGGVA